MKNNYSELYTLNYNKAIRIGEKLIKWHLIKENNKGRSYSHIHNPLLNRISELTYNYYYIVTSKKYNNSISLFENRNSVYKEGYEYKIFDEELFNSFKIDNKEDCQYNYEQFLVELSKIQGLKTIYSRYRHLSKIYELMYQANDFTEFVLWDYFSDVEIHPIFIKYHDFIYGNSNNNITNSTNNTNVNFQIKYKYQNTFRKLYLDFTVDFINSKLTSEEDFINVFFKNSSEHNSKIYFFCKTHVASYLLRKIEFVFKNLSFAQIEKSNNFISVEGNTLKRTNLSQSLAIFKHENIEFSDNFDLQDSIDAVELIIKRLNKNE